MKGDNGQENWPGLADNQEEQSGGFANSTFLRLRMSGYSDTYELLLPQQSVAEEVANTITHGFGIFLSLAGAIALLLIAYDRTSAGHFIGLVVYSLATLSVYTASTLSHAIQHPKRKHWWRIADQAVIYLMIAGTYTPFILAYLPPVYEWSLLALVWGLAAGGFLTKAVLRHRIEAVAVINYVLLGWLPAMVMLRFLSFHCILWMAVGGLLYTVGAIFLVFDQRVPFFHAAWHIFVVLATAAQYYAIVHFAI